MTAAPAQRHTANSVKVSERSGMPVSSAPNAAFGGNGGGQTPRGIGESQTTP